MPLFMLDQPVDQALAWQGDSGSKSSTWACRNAKSQDQWPRPWLMNDEESPLRDARTRCHHFQMVMQIHRHSLGRGPLKSCTYSRTAPAIESVVSQPWLVWIPAMPCNLWWFSRRDSIRLLINFLPLSPRAFVAPSITVIEGLKYEREREKG